MSGRRKVSAAYASFMSEIERLTRLDSQNQIRVRRGPGRPSPATLSARQMTLITEGIFVRAFSSYELFMEDVFILYACGKKTRVGGSVGSFIKPRDGTHARDIIKSHMTFLDWNDADKIIQRCDIYLKNGGPIKLALTSNLTRLRYMRTIRNAIAHKSVEAFARYSNVVRNELRAPPLSNVPEPGEFLQMIDPVARPSYFLMSYLNTLRSVAATCAG